MPCGQISVEKRIVILPAEHEALITHECSGDKEHMSLFCVCKCGYHWIALTNFYKEHINEQST